MRIGSMENIIFSKFFQCFLDMFRTKRFLGAGNKVRIGFLRDINFPCDPFL